MSKKNSSLLDSVNLLLKSVTERGYDSKITTESLVQNLLIIIRDKIEFEHEIWCSRLARFVCEKKIDEKFDKNRPRQSILNVLENSDKWQLTVDDKNFFNKSLCVLRISKKCLKLTECSIEVVCRAITLALAWFNQTNETVKLCKDTHLLIHHIMHRVIHNTGKKITESKISNKPLGARSPLDTIFIQFDCMIKIYNDILVDGFDIDDYESDDMLRSLVAIADLAKCVDNQLALF